MITTLCDDLITDDLRHVESLLHEELQSDAPYVDQLLSYVASLGGKRLRPQLVLLSGHATGGTTSHHTTLATVMEMIHLATLVHDDVLDAASLRRHRPTTRRLWGDQASILLGDHLFHERFTWPAASAIPSPAASLVVQRMSYARGNCDRWERKESLISPNKSICKSSAPRAAELCGCCCLLGAHYAGADPTQCQQLQSFGYQLGLAFQMVDDLLDIMGDSRQTGKSAGGDLRDRKLTLPLIHCLREASVKERQWLLEDQWHDSGDIDRERLSVLLRESNSLGYAKDLATRIAQSARDHLASLPTLPLDRCWNTLRHWWYPARH